MALAHRVDGQAVELFDFVSNQIMLAEAEGRIQGGMPQELQKGIAERMLPVLPQVRDLVRDVSGDVGPMLSFKQQLKLTGDVAMAGTAINAFEQNMQLWSKGQGNPFGDPFRKDEDQPAPLDKDGLSKQASQAKKTAKSNAEGGEWREWKKYVQDAPSIPLFIGPQWGVYNTTRLTGFPSRFRPYASAVPTGSPRGAFPAPDSLPVLIEVKAR